jgi:hypothetical protein
MTLADLLGDAAVDIDTDKIDDAVLALLYLTWEWKKPGRLGCQRKLCRSETPVEFSATAVRPVDSRRMSSCWTIM